MKMMEHNGLDIALIQPPCWGNGTPPLGPALLKSYLAKNGLKARVFDLNILLCSLRHGPYASAWDFKTGGNGLFTRWWSESFVRRMYAFYSHEVLNFMYSVLAAKPGTIGLSVQSHSFIAGRMLASKFKEISPETQIVFGGPHVGRYMRQWRTLLSSGHADAVVFGEGEESLAQYLKADRAGVIPGVARREPGGEIADGGPRPPIPSLDDLPYADFSDFELAAYAEKRVLPTYFSRGCINRCVFCVENQFFPGFRCRSGRRVFNDIAHQISVHPEKKYFLMNESASNADVRELEAFCDLVIDNGLKIGFSLGNAMVRKEMNAKFYSKLKRAGCTDIVYGLESPSKRLLKSVGKTACLDVDIDRVISDGTRAKLTIGINMMFGLPGEQPEDNKQQLAFLRRHRRERKRLIIGGFNFCRFPQGCSVHKNPSEYGVDLSPGETYWSELDGSNTFIDRIAKFENFRAEGTRLGYRNFLSAGADADRDEMLGHYHLHKGESKRALHYLRRSPVMENMTLESVDRIMGLYAELSLEKDGYYNQLSRFKTEQAGDGHSDFENVRSRSDIA
ncbi:MAG: radical SAM protein, partial [bacterium]